MHVVYGCENTHVNGMKCILSSVCIRYICIKNLKMNPNPEM